MTACAFCKVIAGQSPAHWVLAGDEVVAFLDHRPLFSGHTLVLPRVHHETLGELPGPLLGPLLCSARLVASAQRRALGAEGTFFALNDVVSQSVPHVHLHVVPRRRRDGLRGFFWPRSRYPSEEVAEEVAAALRKEVGSAR